MNRGARAVNLTLLILLVTVTASGWVAFAFAVGSPGVAEWIVGVHGASGLGLLLLVPAKSVVVRRGLRRSGRPRKVISWAFLALVGISIASGLLHAIGGRRTYRLPVLPPVLPMQIHVGAGVGAAVLLVGHVVVHQRRRRGRLPHRTDLDRRRALLGTGIAAGSVALWVVAPGRERRETGSHEIADVAAVPVTQWLFDAVPRDPPRSHRPAAGVRACGPGLHRGLAHRAGVARCAGRGARAARRGVDRGRVGDRVPAAVPGRRVAAAGHPPGRSAAEPRARRPGAARRARAARVLVGVKWVDRVEVVDAAWWRQPPFPLQ